MQQECSCRPVRRRCGTAMQSVDTEQGKRVYFAARKAKDRPVEVERDRYASQSTAQIAAPDDALKPDSALSAGSIPDCKNHNYSNDKSNQPFNV
ncbi:hypothetical protein [Paenibacillus algorifonticola]|uniref:hypothetical protein n=1 Tax=Paenibacillus algorifonticola TaxID=684063 RepID=UPI0006194E7E|nr:hypothetical protein [Paenibacillus algorifonticola]